MVSDAVPITLPNISPPALAELRLNVDGPSRHTANVADAELQTEPTLRPNSAIVPAVTERLSATMAIGSALVPKVTVPPVTLTAPRLVGRVSASDRLPPKCTALLPAAMVRLRGDVLVTLPDMVTAPPAVSVVLLPSLSSPP